MWYVGIDWADQHHDAAIIDEHGKHVGKKHVAHSAEGMEELVEFLKGIGDVATHPDQMACIIETNKGLLITALLEVGLPVYPVNPKTLETWRKPSGAKTDAIDAFLLARKGRSDLDQLRRLEPDSPPGAGTQTTDPRPGRSDPDADAAGQSTDRLPQSLLSGGVGAV